MSSEASTRARRVGEGIREELASLLAHRVKDPKASGAVVTRVEMTGDLRSAHVFVRALEGADDPDRRRALVSALRRAAGMMRREIAHKLALRYAPELRFDYDDGLDHTARIEQLLDEVAAERRSRS